MPRADISKNLVHWTNGESYEEAFETLRKIVEERKILGSGELIKGSWECVCFTEAPENTFHQVVGKYKPFGIQAPKSRIFSLGGRPVIYQSNDEYELLPEELKWRHMRYEPDADPPFDFSWEREWRLQTDGLELDSEYSRILVPDESWAQALIDEHMEYEYMNLQLIASDYGDEWMSYPIEDFAFRYTVIDV